MSKIYGQIVSSKIPLIMGILNVTPDSFSDGGKFFNKKSAIEHAENLIKSGADIIDIGGESTRPGSSPVSEKEELLRVIPVIENIRKNNSEIFLSIDTTKSSVAKAAIESGVNLVNDISGGTFDPKIIDLIAANKIAFVVMHIKGKPKNMQENLHYDDVNNEIIDYIEHQIQKIEEQGVEEIIIDPGIGFGKRVEDNFNILNNLEDFKILGKPIIIGVSRKSFLGITLNQDIEARDNSTIITETIAAMKGASIIRTHNVKNAVELKNIYKNLKEPNKLSYV